jgi:hypothetical protein
MHSQFKKQSPNKISVSWVIPKPPYKLKTEEVSNTCATVVFFFLICILGGGVQTGSTRQIGHSLAYCTCPGWLWRWRIWWNEWQGKPKYSEKTCPDATLPTTNPTWPDPRLNPDRRGGKPATKRFSYGAANGYFNKAHQEYWSNSGGSCYFVLVCNYWGSLIA